jgi:NAD(P)-dependent dehydrogenase (short-subunit alcohol dehydrogenase family)
MYTTQLQPWRRAAYATERPWLPSVAHARVNDAAEIGPMIAARLSDDDRWINGQRIEVSGGMAL